MMLVQRLLSAGVDINNPSARLYGRTALEAAVKSEHVQLVVSLLDAGADPHDPHALAAAVRIELDSRILEALLVAHVSRYGRVRPRYGGTALVLAAKMVHISAIDVLVKGGVDINEPATQSYNQRSAHPNGKFPQTGQTALGIALQRSEGADERLVSQLLSYGADPNTVLTREGVEVIALDSGVDVNTRADAAVRRTALQAAVETGDMSLVQFLLDADADPVDQLGPYAGVTAL
jgi:ankyrin repeat protein